MAKFSIVFLMTVGILTIATHFQVAECVNSKQSHLQYRRVDQETLDCHVREFTFMAVNEDPETGLKCQSLISVNSCWGRCGSGEVSIFHFVQLHSAFQNLTNFNQLEKL